MSALATVPKRVIVAAADLCREFQLPPSARPLLLPGIGTGDFLNALLQHGEYAGAIDFTAHALPPREAIWWGCLCLQHATGGVFEAAERDACEAAVRWIVSPSEANRVRAKGCADAAGARSAAGGLARAAQLSGGSLGPANAPVIPPGPYLPAKAVALSLKLVSLRGDAARLKQRQKRYVQLGMQLMQSAGVA